MGYYGGAIPMNATVEPILVESLPPTRSLAVRVLTWEPCPVGCSCQGVATVVVARSANGKRKATRYAVTEFAADKSYGDGRAFRFEKFDGDSGEVAESRNVFLATNRLLSECDCEGKSFAATERADREHRRLGEYDRCDTLGCVHLDTARALVANGWLELVAPTPEPIAVATPEPAASTDAEFETWLNSFGHRGSDVPF